MAADQQERALIAGDGVAGLETVLALQTLAPGRFDISMLAPERHLTYHPLAFGVPLPRNAPARIELASIARDRRFHLIRDAVERVDAEAHEVITQDGARIAYDVLVLTLGARPAAAVEGTIPFRGSQDVMAVTRALQALGPDPARVAYIVRSLSMWSLPAYELALYTAAWAATRDVAVDVILMTAEDQPLQAFGQEASERVAGLLESGGVAFVPNVVVDRLEAGRLQGDMATSIAIDLGVALPYLVGRAVPGLPHDADDFTPVNEIGLVDGVPDVYAIGDMTNRSLKQDSFSAQQADVAAAAIAGVAGVADPDLLTPFAWPTHRFAGVHLAPYLGTHGDLQPATLTGVTMPVLMSSSDDAVRAINIVLADDHEVVRAGLRLLLQGEEGMHVVGEAGDVTSALRLVESSRPDVLVLDLNMPGRSSLSAIADIKDRCAIVVLTMQSDPAFAREALQAGARAYVLKEAAGSELVTAVRTAAGGGTYLNPQLGARLAAEPTAAAAAESPDDLSEREVEVLRLIALGHTNAEIGAQLFLSVRTVETHRSHIQSKLGRTTRADLVRYALQRGLVDV